MESNTNYKPKLQFTKKQLKEAERISLELIKGTPLFKTQKVPQKVMDMVANLAYHSYQSNQYEKSLQVYKLLCLYEHTNTKHFLGVGVSQQKLENYEDAVSAYMTAILLNKDGYSAFFNLSQCLFALGKPELAIEALEEVIKIGKRKPKIKSSATYKKSKKLLSGLKT